MKHIVILGTGGNCIDILDTLLDVNDASGKTVYECIGFLDDDQSKWGKSIQGVKVLGPLAVAKELVDCSFVFGIGSVNNFWKRNKILENTGIVHERFETIIHPTASVSRMAQLGKGTVVFQNVTITSGVEVGKFVYVLPNSVISHSSVIGDFTCIAGGVCISGNVRIGQGCYVGAGSVIRDGIKVGSHSLIGMGSNVLKDVAEDNIVIGNPAKFLRHTLRT